LARFIPFFAGLWQGGLALSAITIKNFRFLLFDLKVKTNLDMMQDLS
jgi:hypothetical protein